MLTIKAKLVLGLAFLVKQGFITGEFILLMSVKIVKHENQD